MATNNNINTTIPIPVTQGGTGVTSLTARGPLLGNGTSALAQATGNSASRPLIGSTGAAPVMAALTSAKATIAGTSSGDNTLNVSISNYASTTFIPTITFGGRSTGITYTSQSGYYMQIDGMVFFTLSIVLSSKGTSTGVAVVGGLPVTISSGIQNMAPGYISNCNFVTGFCGFVQATTKTIILQNLRSATTTQMNDTNFTNTTEVRLSGCYLS